MMTSRRGPRTSVRLPLPALPALIAAFLLAGCAPGEFRLAGTVTIASALQRKAPHENSVLFIVAKNRGDVPVAVHRIVNPQFPVNFRLGPDDLILPGLPTDTPLRVEVEMNVHGELGRPRRGDLAGANLNMVYPSDRHVDIVIDRRI